MSNQKKIRLDPDYHGGSGMSKEGKIALAIIAGAIIIALAIYGGFYYLAEALRYKNW